MDASPVVGIAECRSFGSGWDASRRSRSIFELEIGGAAFDGRDLDLPGTAVHEDNRFDYAVDGVGKRWLGGFRLRFARYLTRHFYLGAGIGFHTGSLAGSRRAGDLEIELRSVTRADAVRRAGRVSALRRRSACSRASGRSSRRTGAPSGRPSSR